MSILSGMDGTSAMLNALHAEHVHFTVNVPMWEVSILKKRLFQANIDVGCKLDGDECGSGALYNCTCNVMTIGWDWCVCWKPSAK